MIAVATQHKHEYHVPCKLHGSLLKPYSKASTLNPSVKVIMYRGLIITPWLQAVSELYRLSDGRLSAKLVPTFAARGVSCGQCGRSLGHNLGFLVWSRFFFFQVAPELYS
jgi:hypothetical protein